MLHITGEIQYNDEGERVHSDICIKLQDLDLKTENLKGESQSYFRLFLHDCLDEWLDHQDTNQTLNQSINNFYLTLSEHDHD